MRLLGGGRVADLGCGEGWSTLAVAGAYPEAEVWGIDNDEASIAAARAAAGEAGLRVRFESACSMSTEGSSGSTPSDRDGSHRCCVAT